MMEFLRVELGAYWSTGVITFEYDRKEKSERMGVQRLSVSEELPANC